MAGRHFRFGLWLLCGLLFKCGYLPASAGNENQRAAQRFSPAVQVSNSDVAQYPHCFVARGCGKRANCRAPISPRYLFVELLTGLLFLAVRSIFLAGLEGPCGVGLRPAIAGSFIDIDHQICGMKSHGAALRRERWRRRRCRNSSCLARGGKTSSTALALPRLVMASFGALFISGSGLRAAQAGISTNPRLVGDLVKGLRNPVLSVDGQEEGWSNIFNCVRTVS